VVRTNAYIERTRVEPGVNRQLIKAVNTYITRIFDIFGLRTQRTQVYRLQAAPDSATGQHPSSVCHLMTGIYVYSPLNLSYFFLDCTIAQVSSYRKI
jgi:hypothetical protein